MRYLVFAFDTDYPRGGMDDLQDMFDTREEALEFIDECIADPEGYTWFQVWDIETGEMMRQSRNGPRT
jgi:hypothetical protein